MTNNIRSPHLQYHNIMFLYFPKPELSLGIKEYEIHPQSNCIIVAVLSGRIDLYFDDVQLSIPQGCFIIFDKRKHHVLKGNKSKAATVCVIQIDLDHFTDAYQTKADENFEPCINDNECEYYTSVYTLDENNLGHSISQLVKWKSEIIDLSNCTQKVCCTGVIVKEILLLHSFTHLSLLRIPTKNKTVAKNIYYNLLNAKLLILRDLNIQVSVSRMARAANISEAHFARYFKIVFKVAPAQYRIQVGTDKAAEMLRRTTLPVSDIAARVGFESLSSFSRNFKNKCGITPGDYRKHNALPEYMA